MIRGNDVIKSGSGNLYTIDELIDIIEDLELKVKCLTDCVTELNKKFTVQDGVLTEDEG